MEDEPKPSQGSPPSETSGQSSDKKLRPLEVVPEEIRWARALQRWHTNPDAYPRAFVSYQLSDFDV